MDMAFHEVKFYKLDGHNVLPATREEWQKKLGGDEVICLDKFKWGRVSTVFLGITSTGLPFETMVFGGVTSKTQRRYETWAEAEAGHAEILAQAKEANERNGVAD